MAKIILVANTDWYLYNFRLSLARFLKGEGFEVLFASPAGRFTSLLEDAGFRWIWWEVSRKSISPFNELASVRRLLGIYHRENPHLVHHFTVKPVLYGSVCARLAGVPGLVNSITGLGYVFLGKDPKAIFIKQIVKGLYRLALAHPNRAVIFENQADRGYFTSEGLVGADHSWLIAGVGIDTERFTARAEPTGVPVVVLPARMLWDKGVGVVVEAARLLHQRVGVRVALVGEPDPGNPASIDRTVLEGWAREGVIEWWGWREDMEQVYASSHIVTLPSMGEGLPTALLEAAASGRPIVTTDVPGCREAVIDGVSGYLVPPNDPLALAEALARLVRDADLRGRMGAAGRQLVLERYTNIHVNTATLAIYQKLLSSPPKRPGQDRML